MSDSVTSHRAVARASASMHDECESDRRIDLMYRILTDEDCAVRQKLVRGIVGLVEERSKHPAVTAMVERLGGDHSVTLQRALIAAALVYEPDFMQYMLDAPDTCSSTLSQYAVVGLPAPLDALLDGNTSLENFVLDITHAYTVL